MKPKVGDTVRIINPHEAYCGTLCTVDRTLNHRSVGPHTNRLIYLCRYPDGHATWFDDDEIEVVPKEAANG